MPTGLAKVLCVWSFVKEILELHVTVKFVYALALLRSLILLLYIYRYCLFFYYIFEVLQFMYRS
jgi:hypothetical protein